MKKICRLGTDSLHGTDSTLLFLCSVGNPVEKLENKIRHRSVRGLFLIDDDSFNDNNKTMIHGIDETTGNENESRNKSSDVYQSTDISYIVRTN